MNKRKYRFVVLVTMLLAAIVFAGGAFAHDGPVDEDGCHLDDEERKHCH